MLHLKQPFHSKSSTLYSFISCSILNDIANSTPSHPHCTVNASTFVLTTPIFYVTDSIVTNYDSRAPNHVRKYTGPSLSILIFCAERHEEATFHSLATSLSPNLNIWYLMMLWQVVKYICRYQVVEMILQYSTSTCIGHNVQVCVFIMRFITSLQSIILGEVVRSRAEARAHCMGIFLKANLDMAPNLFVTSEWRIVLGHKLHPKGLVIYFYTRVFG